MYTHSQQSKAYMSTHPSLECHTPIQASWPPQYISPLSLLMYEMTPTPIWDFWHPPNDPHSQNFCHLSVSIFVIFCHKHYLEHFIRILIPPDFSLTVYVRIKIVFTILSHWREHLLPQIWYVLCERLCDLDPWPRGHVEAYLDDVPDIGDIVPPEFDEVTHLRLQCVQSQDDKGKLEQKTTFAQFFP